MSRVRVKICGVRTLNEAQTAEEAGADALGFNFWPGSPRFIEPSSARQIIEKLSPLVNPVGVFVNEGVERITSVAADLGLHSVQLHGDESPAFCERLSGLKTIKAIRVGRDFDVGIIAGYPASMILLDACIEGSYGGTGRQFDWRVAMEATRLRPIILAGGLNLENVTDAIIRVRPAAIDVCSGLEIEPGRKDLERLRSFMKVVAAANASMKEEEVNNFK